MIVVMPTTCHGYCVKLAKWSSVVARRRLREKLGMRRSSESCLVDPGSACQALLTSDASEVGELTKDTEWEGGRELVQATTDGHTIDGA